MNIVVRVARRLAARVTQANGHPGRIAAVLLIAVGGVIALASLNVFPSLRFSMPSGPGLRLSPGNEPAATATYLKGQQTFDAKLVWDSYSERVLQDLRQRGATVDDTQRQLDRVRQVGSRIEQVQYIGGYSLQHGSMQFYVVTRTGRCSSDAPQASSARARPVAALAQTTCDPVYVPYVFTLDDKGKIDRVE
jgi:hypothetical protein